MHNKSNVDHKNHVMVATDSPASFTEELEKALTVAVKFINEHDLQKIQWSYGDISFSCESKAPLLQVASPAVAPCKPEKPAIEDHREVKADMVGTLYVAPSPGDPPYITVGSKISEGQTIFIIEAMKVMNHIKSPFSGVVKEILVHDEQAVEYGQALVRLI